MRPSHLFLMLFLGLFVSTQAQARLEVCNQSDLVLMIAVGYDTTEERTVSEGWWKLYPGYCAVPVDVAFLKGNYYVHAESNPRSTMPGDAFTWGDDKPLCVELADFRMPNGNQCQDDNVAIKFNQVGKNWRNSNKVDIYYPKRRYENQFRAKVAGVQRLLSLLGYDVGDIDGIAGEKTVAALNEIGKLNKVFGFDLDQIFPILEQMIAKKQKLDN